MSIEAKERNRSLVRLAGFFGVLGSVLPMIMVLDATVLSSWFRWDINALSELGVGEQSALFNSAVILGGVFNFLFALGLQQYLNRERLVKAGILSIMLGSMFLALVGVFTINTLALHGIVAFGYFVLSPLGLLLIGFGTEENTIRKLNIVCGLSALVAILVLPVIIFGLSLRIGFAVPEEIEALIIAAWTLFMSSKLMRLKNSISNWR